MSSEKVRRYDLNLTQVIHLGETHADYVAEMLEREGTGRYIEYADVAGLVEAMKKVHELASHPTRPFEESNDEIERLARNELARWQS